MLQPADATAPAAGTRNPLEDEIADRAMPADPVLAERGASVPAGPPAVTEYGTRPGSVTYEALARRRDGCRRRLPTCPRSTTSRCRAACRRCTSICTCTRPIRRSGSSSSINANTARARRSRKDRASSEITRDGVVLSQHGRRFILPRQYRAKARATATDLSAAAIAAESLDGLRLNRAFRAGILRLLSRQEHLNKINVFPVPDGDTGTNLAITHGRGARCPAARRRMRMPATRSPASRMPRSTARAAIRARSSRSSCSGSATSWATSRA